MMDHNQMKEKTEKCLEDRRFVIEKPRRWFAGGWIGGGWRKEKKRSAALRVES